VAMRASRMLGPSPTEQLQPVRSRIS
jgi:hypothetical protein